jgi:hypothetical protein
MVPTGEIPRIVARYLRKIGRRLRTMKVKSHGDIFVLLLEFAGTPGLFRWHSGVENSEKRCPSSADS